VALRSGYSTVVTAHGIRSEDTKYSNSWGQRLRFYFDSVITERSVIRQTRHMIAISRYVTEYFAPLLRPDINIYKIPNAVDEQFFNITSETPGRVILFAGRVTPIKRVMDLVQSFAQVVAEIPSAQLRIAGECNSESAYAESIRQWIRQAGLEEHIHLLGELRQEAILHEFSRCVLLALPSAQENAPLVIAQAMAAGKPVVATRVGGIPEMVGEADKRGLLVNVGDVAGLAQGMLRLLRDPVLQTQMGQAGQAFAREYYHQDRVAQRTYEVYQHIADAGRGFDV
jgi:glycosyltransferase involved in cell wall biosynthesis